MLTADLPNLSPDEYRPMSKRRKQVTGLAEEYEQSGSIELWWKLNDVTNLTVKLGSGETATLTEKLLPNESTTLTVWHHVKDRVTDPSYTITAAGGINENGTVYLNYPDIGISQMEVIAESAGKRTVRMTLYNSSAATLAGGKNREVKLAFYADDLHTKPAEAACTTNGVSVSGNDSGATSTLVTAASGNGEPIFLPGTAHRPPCPAYHGCRSSSPIIRNRDAAYCVPVSSVRLWSHLPDRHRNSPTIRRTTCSVCTSRNSTGREFTRSTSRPM